MPEQIRTEGAEALESCDVFLIHKWQALSEIRQAYEWGHKEQMGQSLESVYPNGIPRRVITGVLSFHHGVQAGLNERYKEK